MSFDVVDLFCAVRVLSLFGVREQAPCREDGVGDLVICFADEPVSSRWDTSELPLGSTPLGLVL